MIRIILLAVLLSVANLCHGQEFKPLIDVPYGKHARNVLDFYPAKSDGPSPVVLHIHGGGWRNGDKSSYPRVFRDKGISVVAINYRYVQNGVEDGVNPPVKASLGDAARALQFVRSKASEWGIDKNRIAATGGSAGGCSSLWLALHDDMADPNSDDPIARESTRLYCAAVNGAQVSLDPKELREWMPNYRYGAHAFGLRNFQSLIDNRENVLSSIKEYSPIEHVSSDDPPIAMFYGGEKPVVGSSPRDPTHSGILGIKLAERLTAANVDVVLVHPGQPHPKYSNANEYLIDRLLAPVSQTAELKDGASAALPSVQYLPADNLTRFSVIGQSNQSGDDRKNVFSVGDGVVVADQAPGHLLVTNAEYEDYKLEIEYRWTTKDAKRDSGIFVNVKGSKANEPLAPGEKMRAIEVNLLGPERWKQKSWSGLVWLYSPGRDSVELTVEGTVHRRGTASSAPQDYERSYGEWNSVEITNTNSRFLVELNGNVVAKGTNPLPSTGKIALQSGGIEFRRMVVTPLDVRDLKSRSVNSASLGKPSTGSVAQASALAESGDLTAAAEMLEQLFAADPSAMDTISGLGLATLYASSGQKDQHRQFCERLQKKFSDWTLPPDAERPAKAYLLFPGADDAEMLKNADAATRHAVAQGRGGMRVWFELSRGMAQYRLGDYAGATKSLRNPLQGKHPAQRIEAHAFAAMAAYQTGQATNARQLLTAAKDEFNRADRSKLNWNDLIASQITINEAEALINPQELITPEATDSSSTSPVANREGLSVYGIVPGLAPSDKYRFRVRTAKGKWQEPFAFITTCKKGDGGKTNNYFQHLNGWSNTYINFEMSRPVEIAIGKSNGQPIRKAAAHPKHKVASCTVRGGFAYIVMNEPGLIAVDIDGQMDDQDTGKGYKGPAIHTVTVFANPFLKNRPQRDDPAVHLVKPGEEAPRDGSWKTLYFLPGVHDIGVGYPLRANTNYYIPGDAIVYGTMNNLENRKECHDIQIFGHGTLSGARIAHPRYASPKPKDEKMHNSIRIIDASNTTVEGITLADSAHHTLQMVNFYKDPKNALTDIRWVKVFTWRGNGDGIVAGANGSMEDCFIRTQDDCTYVVPGRPIRRVTFWNDYNGSAFVFSLLSNRPKIIEDCDVIYSRAGWHHWSGGRTFNMRGKGRGRFGEGVVFRNIRISDPRPTLQHFMIAMESVKPYGKSSKRGAGDMSGVLFQNIEIAAPSVLGEPEYLWGMPNGMIRNITFDNVTIGGKKLTSLRQFKHNEHVKDFTFK